MLQPTKEREYMQNKVYAYYTYTLHRIQYVPLEKEAEARASGLQALLRQKSYKI